jgi:hypothetical protein
LVLERNNKFHMVAIVVVQRHEVKTNPSTGKGQTDSRAVWASNRADLGQKRVTGIG